MSASSKHTVIGLNLARSLAEHDCRIFDTDTAYKFGSKLGIKDSYLVECLHNLGKQGWILPLKKGLYALAPVMLAGQSIHEYEIAMALARPAAISFWSAVHFHQLTDQIPHKVFVLTTTDTTVPKGSEIIINGVHYHFVTTKEEYYFGLKKVYIGVAAAYVTDLERTLLDIAMNPKYCGGIAEVLDIFRNLKHNSNFNLDTMINYATRLGSAASRRFGWILENVASVPSSKLKLLEQSTKGYIKLDPSGKAKGACNGKWGIIQNI